MTKIEFIYKMAGPLQEAIAGGARLNSAVALAQAALESQWGNTALAREGNNLFSIKAGVIWTGETLVLPGEEWGTQTGWSRGPVVWRKYANWTECILDYAAILSDVSWYRDTLSHVDNPIEFLRALLPNGTEPGWATDPDYLGKVERIGLEIEALGGPAWRTIDNLNSP